MGRKVRELDFIVPSLEFGIRPATTDQGDDSDTTECKKPLSANHARCIERVCTLH